MGTFDTPSEFYGKHGTRLGVLRDELHDHFAHHWMNARVCEIRAERFPVTPNIDQTNHSHEETNRAA